MAHLWPNESQSSSRIAMFCFAILAVLPQFNAYCGFPPPTVPTVTIQAPSTASENEGTYYGFLPFRSVSFTASLSFAYTSDVTVGFQPSSSSTATQGDDFYLTAGTVTVPAGQTTAQISVLIRMDGLDDADSESVIVDLVQSTTINATVGSPSSATYTILDDDDPPTVWSITPSSGTFNEGNQATVTVAITPGSNRDVYIPFSLSGTAASSLSSAYPADYTFSPSSTGNTGMLHIAPGQSSADITLTFISDHMYEDDEPFTITLGSPTNANMPTALSGSYTLHSSDAKPTVSVSASPASCNEGSNATFTISLSSNTSVAWAGSPVTVSYSTQDGTARAAAPDSDYTAASGSVVFDPEQTVKSVSVATRNDSLYELPENFSLNISAPSNTQAGNLNQSFQINDVNSSLKPIASISYNGTSNLVNEGQPGTFKIQLNPASGTTTTINYSTVNASATGGTSSSNGDFQNWSAQPVVFAPGETLKTFSINTFDDTLYELQEDFSVTIALPSGNTNAVISSTANSQQCIIDANDSTQKPTASVGYVTGSGVDEGLTARYKISLDKVSGTETRINYTTVDGTATGAASQGVPDYRITAGTAVFTAGETTKSVDISTVVDDVYEKNGHEIFYLDISLPAGNTNAVIGTNHQPFQLNETQPSPALVLTPQNSQVDESATCTVFNLSLNTKCDQVFGYSLLSNDGLYPYYRESESPDAWYGNGSSIVFEQVVDDQTDSLTTQASAPGTVWSGESFILGNTADWNPLNPHDPWNDDHAIFSADLKGPLDSVAVELISSDGDTYYNSRVTYRFENGFNYAPDDGSHTAVIYLGARNEDQWYGLERNVQEDYNSVTGMWAVELEALTIVPRSGAAAPVTVGPVLSSQNYIARSGSDFDGVSYSDSFPVGQTTKPAIVIPIHDNTTDQQDRYFQLTAYPSSFGSWSGPATREVLDNDALPTATLSGLSTVTEAQTTTSLHIDLNTTSAKTIRVRLTTSDDTASAGHDYDQLDKPLVFSPGSMHQTIGLAVHDDIYYEGLEKLGVHLSDEHNADVSQEFENLWIVDDESTPVISIGASSSGLETSSPAVIPLRLSDPPTSLTVSVQYSLSGTATAGIDYVDETQTPASPTLSFLPGVRTRNVSLRIIDDAMEEPAETVHVNLSTPVNARLDTIAGATHTIVDDDGLGYLEILPSDVSTLGPGKSVRLQAIGHAGSGRVLGAVEPLWSVLGPGTITSSGYYTAPIGSPIDQVRVVATMADKPEVTGNKDLRIDGIPPHVVDLKIGSGSPINEVAAGGLVSGIATTTWTLSTAPVELSPPVKYTVLIDNRFEVVRLSSTSATTVPLVLSATFDADGLANGEHLLTVVAEDALGNSNVDSAPAIEFMVNSGSHTGADAGRDWLLRHQWRNGDASFGSWQSFDPRSTNELLVEATFAADTLAGENLAYVSSGNNIYTASPVSVAQAYHDTICWLGKAWRNGSVTDFATKALVTEALARAVVLKPAVQRELGSVSTDYDQALSFIKPFFNDEPGLMSRLLPDGGLAQGEESLSNRFETLLGLETIVAAGRDQLLANWMVGSDAWSSLFQYLEPLSGGWTNVPLDEVDSVALNQDNFYLSSNLLYVLKQMQRRSTNSQIYRLSNSATSFLLREQAQDGSMPAEAPSVNDTAAGVYGLVWSKLLQNNSVPTTAVLLGANNLLTTQSAADGSWNGRALDTAWAMRALRSELTIDPNQIGFDPVQRTFSLQVSNRGALNAGAVRVSLFGTDPSALTVRERLASRIGATNSNLLEVGTTTSVGLLIGNQPLPATLYFMVDAENAYAEYDETNNVVSWALPAAANLRVFADLITAQCDAGGPPIAGSPWHIDVPIYNYGVQPVDVSIPNLLTISMHEGSPLLEQTFRPLIYQAVPGTQPLKAGEAAIARIEIPATYAGLQVARVYDLYFWADPQSGKGGQVGRIPEAIETDNIAHRPVEVFPVGGAELPDLSVDSGSIRYVPQPFCTSSAGVLTARIDNLGASMSSGALIAIAYDDLLTSNTVNVGPLQKGQSAILKVPLAYPSPGTYNVRVIADPQNTLIEKSKANNLALQQMVVHDCENSAYYDLAISPDDIWITSDGGGARTVHARVHNFGQAFTSAMTADLFIRYRDLITTENVPLHISQGMSAGGTLEFTGTPSNLLAWAPPSGQLNIEVQISALRNASDSSPVEMDLANNIASRSFEFSKTNLRLVSFSASANPAYCISLDSITTSVDLTVTVANGDGTTITADAANVSLEIYDDSEGRLIGYTNNLSVPAATGSSGVLSNLITLKLPGVPLAIGDHQLRASIDPQNAFAESNENDNSLGFTEQILDTHSSDRAFPDLEILSAETLVRVGDYVVLDTTIHNRASSTGATLPAKNFTVEVVRDSIGGTSVAAPVTIEQLDAGEDRHIFLPTSVTHAQLDAGVVFWVRVNRTHSPQERAYTNNDAMCYAKIPSTPTLRASAVFTTAYLNWDAPTTTGNSLAIKEWILARYRVESDNSETFERVDRKEAAARAHIDNSTPLLVENQKYRYRLWLITTDNDISNPSQADVVTGSVPRISAVSCADGTNPHTQIGDDSPVIGLPCDHVRIVGTFYGQTPVELYRNNVYVTTVDPIAGHFTFENIPLLPGSNHFVAIGRKSIEGNAYTKYSNEVILYQSTLPDLEFKRDPTTEIPDVKMERLSAGQWISVPDLADSRNYDGQKVRLTAAIANNTAIPAGPFKVRFAVTVVDSSNPDKAQTLEGLTTVDSLVDASSPSYVLSPELQLPESTTVRKIEVKLDYLKTEVGVVETGVVAETNEGNNTAYFDAGRVDTQYSKEFWIAFPYLFRAEDNRLNLEKPIGSLNTKITFISPSKTGQQNQLNFSTFVHGSEIPYNNKAWWQGPSCSFWEGNTFEYLTSLRSFQGMYDDLPAGVWNGRAVTEQDDPYYRYWMHYCEDGDYNEYLYDGCSLKISSAKPVSGMFWMDHQDYPDSFLMFPREQLGSMYVLASMGGKYAGHQEDCWGEYDYFSDCSRTERPAVPGTRLLGKHMPSWFQVLATEDNTTVVVHQNAIGVPTPHNQGRMVVHTNPLGSPADRETTTVVTHTQVDSKTYKVFLPYKGMTYVWHSLWNLEDPTGVVIESEDPSKKIAVFNGSFSSFRVTKDGGQDFAFTMVPPIDKLGTQNVIAKWPMDNVEDKLRDADDSNHQAVLDKNDRYQNGITRVIAYTTTTVGVSPPPAYPPTLPWVSNTWQTTLAPGQWLEIGESGYEFGASPNDPYTNYFIPVNYSTTNSGANAGLNYYDWQNLQGPVKRTLDRGNIQHTVTSDKPVLVYQYMMASDAAAHENRYRARELSDNNVWVDLAGCSSPGDTSISWIPPTQSFTTDEFIPIPMASGMFDYPTNDWNDFVDPHQDTYNSTTHKYERHADFVNGRFLAPRQYLTVIAKPDSILAQPRVLLNWLSNKLSPTFESDDHDISSQVAFSLGRTSGWSAVGGYQTCNAHEVSCPAAAHELYLHNPDHIPLQVHMNQYGYHRAIAYPVNYTQGQPANVFSGDYVDLAVGDGSIRFPLASAELVPGEATLARIEVVNNGSYDVSEEHQNRALLRVSEVRSGAKIELSSSTIPLTGRIGRYGSVPFLYDISYTPSKDSTALVADVVLEQDVRKSNNSTTQPLVIAHAADLKVENVQALPAKVDNWQAGTPVTVSATVRNLYRLVPETSVEFAFRRGGSTSVTTYSVPLRFSPDTFVSTDSFQALATATISYIPPASGSYLVTANVNPDRTIVEDTFANNKMSASFSLANMGQGNLVLGPLTSSASFIGRNDSVTFSANVSNDAYHAYDNVVVRAYIGDPRFGGPATQFGSDVWIGHLATNQTVPFTLTGALATDGPNTIYVGVNPDKSLIEDRYDDNWSWSTVTVVPTNGPDLGLGQQADFAPQNEVVRGLTVPLSAYVTNIGLGNATSPYKVQVIDGAPTPRLGSVLCESIFNLPSGTVQVPHVPLHLTGAWDTVGAALGDHPLYLVIDSPDHLAATYAPDAAEISAVPLRARALNSADGIFVYDSLSAAGSVPFEIEVYATDDSMTTVGKQLGSWSSLSGFSNSDGSTGTLQVSSNAPVYLLFRTLNGLPFPASPEEFRLDVTFAQDSGTTGQPVLTPISIALPSNSSGQWGSRIGFWVADDGSSYFSTKYHLGLNYCPAPSIPISAQLAMNDTAGAVAEQNEENNRIIRVVKVLSPDKPNLRFTRFEADPTVTGSGEDIAIRATIVNDGLPTDNDFRVKLTVGSLAEQSAQVIAEPYVLNGLQTSETRDLQFTWNTGLNVGDFILTCTLDSQNEIAEGNEADNLAVRPVHVDGTTSLSLANLPLQIPAYSDLPVSATVASIETSSATLSLEIICSTGEVYTIDLRTSNPLELYGTHDFVTAWPTVDHPSGMYRVRARLQKISADGLSQDSQAMVVYSNYFELLPDKRLSCDLFTDRATYSPGDKVQLHATVRNDSINYVFPKLSSTIAITNSHGVVRYQFSPPDETINLARSATDAVDHFWSNPLPLDAALTATLTAFEDLNSNGIADAGEKQSVAQTSFTYSGETVLGADLDLYDENLSDVRYTSVTQTAALASALADEDLTTSDMMFLSDRPVAGNGLLIRNYVPNGDFETLYNAVPSRPVGWATGNAGMADVLSTTATHVYGSYAAAVVGQNGSWTGTSGADPSIVAAGIPVPSSAFNLSFWHKEASVGSGLRVYIVQRDQDGHSLGEIPSYATYSSLGRWSREDFAFRPTQNTRSLGLRLVLSGPTSQTLTSYIDGVQLEEGTVATSWSPDPLTSSSGYATNLLYNPSLTLDSGYPWGARSGATFLGDENWAAGDHLPDAWNIGVEGTTAPAIVEAPELLPADLTERGLTNVIRAGNDATTVSLIQGRIAILPDTPMLFSVFAGASVPGGTVSLLVRQYDINNDEHPEYETTTQYPNAGASLQRFALPFTTAHEMVAVAVQIVVGGPGEKDIAAAQLEAGTQVSSWCGWVPYSSQMQEWRLKHALVEGIKRAEVQLLDYTGRAGRRPSAQLALDRGNRDGKLENGLYAVAYNTASLTPEDASRLFDGNRLSAPLTISSTTTVTATIELPGSPEISAMVLHFLSAPVAGTQVVLEGAYEPGEWLPVYDSPVSMNMDPTSFLAENIHTQFDRYRLSVISPVPSSPQLSEIELRGTQFPASDTMVYDTTPPSADWLLPSEGALVGGATTSSLAFTAIDKLAGIDSVQFAVSDGGGVRQTWTPAHRVEGNYYEATMDLQLIGDGPRIINATATDRAGNRSDLVSRSISIDATPPVVSNPQFINLTTGNDAWVKMSDQLQLQATVTDNNPLTTSNVFADLSPFGLSNAEPATSSSASVFRWSLNSDDISTPTDGIIWVHVWAVDNAGNRSVRPDPSTSVHSDNTPPTIQLEPIGGNWFNTSNLTVAGDAVDNADGLITKVTYLMTPGSEADATPTAGSFDSAQEPFTFSLQNLADDKYSLQVHAVDAAGNIGHLPDALEFSVVASPARLNVSLSDETIPSFEFTKNSDLVVVHASYRSGEIVPSTLVGDLTDLGGFEDDVPFDATDTDAYWYVAPVHCAVPDGVLSVTIQAIDVFSRNVVAHGQINSDNSMPVTTLSSVSAIITTNSINMDGEARDVMPGKIASAEYSLDVGAWLPVHFVVPPADNTVESFTVPLTALSEGRHRVRTRATDYVGNRQPDNVTSATFLVDTIAPVIKAVRLVDQSTSSTRYFKDGDVIDLSANLEDADDLTTAQILADLTPLGGTAAAPAASFVNRLATWRITSATAVTGVFLSPRDGVVTVTLQATDEAGNRGTGSASIVADNIPPTSTLLLREPDPTPNIDPDLGGIASDSGLGVIRHVQFRVDEGTWLEAYPHVASADLLSGAGFGHMVEEYDAHTTMTQDTTHTVQARAIDWAGNIQLEPYPSVTFYIDRSLLKKIASALLFNEDLHDTDYAHQNLVRNGSHLGIYVNMFSDLIGTELVADVGQFGIEPAIRPATGPTAGRHSMWPLMAVVATTPHDGLTSADVWIQEIGTSATVTKVRAWIVADNTAPTVTLSGTYAALVSTSTLILTGRAIDTGCDVTRIGYYVDDEPTSSPAVPLDTGFDSMDEQFRIRVTLPDGNHTIRIVAYDRVGNEGTALDTFTVDTSHPPISDVSVVDRVLSSTTLIANEHATSVTARLWDPYVTAEQLHADLSRVGGSTDTLAEQYVNGLASWTVPVSSTTPTDGIVTATAWIRWQDGATSTAVGQTLADNAEPHANVLSSVPPVSASHFLSIDGNSTDPWPGTVAGTEVRIDGGGWAPLAASDGTYDTADESWTIRFGPYSSGYHTFNWRASDRAGHVQSDITSVTVLFDTQPPVMTIDQPTSFTWFKQVPVKMSWSSNSVDLETSSGIVELTSFDEGVTTASVASDSTVSSEGRYLLSVAGIDAAGNVSETTSTSFGIDQTSPVLTLDSAPTLIAITSQTLAGQTSDSQSLQSGVAHVFWRVDAGQWTTATLAEDGRFQFAVDGVSEANSPHLVEVYSVDHACNTSVVAAHSITVDQTSPTVSIGSPSLTITSSTQVSFTVTYAGASQVTLDDSQVHLISTGTAAGVAHVSGSGAVLRTVTISSITGDGTLAIAIDAGTASDAVGNLAPAPANSSSFVVDNTAPVVTPGSPSVSLTRTGPVGIPINVTGAATVALREADITLNNSGSASATFTVSQSTTNQPLVTLQSISGDGQLGIVIAGGVARDEAGNPSAGVSSETFWVDNTRPQITSILRSDSNPTSATAVGYDITISEPVTGLSASNFTITGSGVSASISAVTGSATNWHVNLSSVAGTGTVGIDLSSGSGVSDAAGNTLVAPFSGPLYAIDQTAPYVTQITRADQSPTSSTIVNYLVTFSENVSGVTASNFTLTGNGVSATVGTVSGSGSTRLVQVASVSGNGTLRLDVTQNLGNIRDSVSNQLVAAFVSGESYTIDQSGPPLVIDQPTTGSWTNQPTRVTWHTGNSDLRTSEGYALWSALENSQSTTFTLSSGDYVSTEGLYLISAFAMDLLGNLGPWAEVVFGIDSTIPQITLTRVNPSPTNSSTVSYTGTAHDYHGSGIRMVFYRLDGTSQWTTVTAITAAPTVLVPTLVNYSFAITTISGNHTIEVKCQDNAGNWSTTLSNSVMVDLIAPQVTITKPVLNSTISADFDLEAQVVDNLSGVTSGTVMYRFAQSNEIWNVLPLISGDSTSGTYKLRLDSWAFYDGPVTLQVRAADQAGNNENTSASDANAALTTCTINNQYPPQAPTGVTAAYASYTHVQITWNKNTEPDFASYKLYRKVKNSTPIAEGDLRLSGMTDSSETTGNIYLDPVSITTPNYWSYALKAADAAGNASFFSRNFSVLPPDSPDRMNAIGGNQKVDLQWRPVRDGFVKGYNIYRWNGSTQTTFTLLTYVNDRETSAYRDSSVTNGTEYSYFVRALDGADNPSNPSEIVTATPGLIASHQHTVIVRFEDHAKTRYVDWDYNDIGAKYKAVLYLTPDDNVSTVVINATLIGHDNSGSGYNLFSTFAGFNGIGTYSGFRTNSNGGQLRNITSHAFNVTSSDGLTANLPLFQKVAAGGSDSDNYGDLVTLTVVLNSPTLNPYSNFDKIPFDTWVENIGDATSYHIFDPENGENFTDAVYMNEDDPDNAPMAGVWLTSGLIIRKLDWEEPFNGRRIWKVYPDFVGWANHYRDHVLKNTDWYYNGPYNNH